VTPLALPVLLALSAAASAEPEPPVDESTAVEPESRGQRALRWTLQAVLGAVGQLGGASLGVAPQTKFPESAEHPNIYGVTGAIGQIVGAAAGVEVGGLHAKEQGRFVGTLAGSTAAGTLGYGSCALVSCGGSHFDHMGVAVAAAVAVPLGGIVGWEISKKLRPVQGPRWKAPEPYPGLSVSIRPLPGGGWTSAVRGTW